MKNKLRIDQILIVLLVAGLMKIAVGSQMFMPFNADEAIVALMARHIKQGSIPVSIRFPGGENIFLYLLYLPFPVSRSVLVDHAERAAVVRTSHRGLDQKRPALGGGAVYGSFVTHKGSLYKIPSSK